MYLVSQPFHIRIVVCSEDTDQTAPHVQRSPSMDGWMDDSQFYILSIVFQSYQDDGRLCATELHLWLRGYRHKRASNSVHTLVAQWVKHWPADLGVLGSIPHGTEFFLTINRPHIAFHYHSPFVLI